VTTLLNVSYQVRSSSAQEYLHNLNGLLRALLQVSVASQSCSSDHQSHTAQRTCIGLPDAFVCPRALAMHTDLLRDTLTSNSGSSTPSSYGHLDEIDQSTLFKNFSDIQRRNEAMLFLNLPPHSLSSLSSAVSDIQVTLLIAQMANLTENLSSSIISQARQTLLLSLTSIPPPPQMQHSLINW
jgi:mediator of RNA polymerase II transcription subunit 12, fungi type